MDELESSSTTISGRTIPDSDVLHSENASALKRSY